MPVLRAVLHIDCVGCGASLPLAGVATNVTCEACRWQGVLEPDRWRWVLAGRPATMGVGEQIRGDVEPAEATCPACATAIDDAAIESAVSHGAPSVACVRCHATLPVRKLDARFTGHVAAALGEGMPVQAGPAQLNVPCKNCGAQVGVDGSTRAPTCAYCGTVNTLDASVWQQIRPLAHPFYLWMTRAAARDAAREPAAPAAAASPLAFLRFLPLAIAGIVIAVLGIVGAVFWQVHQAVAPLAGLAGGTSPSGTARGWGVAGGACNGMKAACSTDKKSELQCSGAAFKVALTCKGPKGCRVVDNGDSISCDYTLADENDPCCVDDSACSTDHKSELECDGTKFVKKATCKGPDGCALTPEAKGGYTLSCDDHIADPGDPCVGAGRFACDSGKKSMLVCKGGKFTLARRCAGRKGCSVSSDAVAQTSTVRCD